MARLAGDSQHDAPREPPAGVRAGLILGPHHQIRQPPPGRWHRRNAEMATLDADGCTAFLRGASPGTTAAIRLAQAAGIPVWVYTQW